VLSKIAFQGLLIIWKLHGKARYSLHLIGCAAHTSLWDRPMVSWGTKAGLISTVAARTSSAHLIGLATHVAIRMPSIPCLTWNCVLAPSVR
jgi:hypothetical protein